MLIWLAAWRYGTVWKMTERTRKPLNLLPEAPVYVAPSILSADFANFGAGVKAITEAGADLVHVDIMDGHFVPNITFGPSVVAALRPYSDLPFDVHFMISDPGKYLEPFVKAGADHVTVHVESDGDLHEVMARIHGYGCSAGITLRPGTPAEAVLPYLPEVEMVLVMTVEPGFGGQSFRDDQLGKIAFLHRAIAASGRRILLEVDGGIGPKTAPLVLQAGADTLVAGSSVFHSPDGYGKAIEALRCR